MRIILDTVFNNDDLPIINPTVGLLRDSLIAGYQMMDNQDFSGNKNHFSWNGTFDSKGAVLQNDADHIITTPVMEADEMTVILCLNIPSSNAKGSILNNLNASTSPPQGTRLTKLADAGSIVGQFDIAKNTTGFNSFGLDIASGWLVKAFAWKGDNLRVLNKTGYTDFAFTSRKKGVSNPFRLNGVPDGIGGGSFTNGFSGNLAFALFYGEYLTPSQVVDYMNLVTQIVQPRGIVV